jgi:hypothetical protein
MLRHSRVQIHSVGEGNSAIKRSACLSTKIDPYVGRLNETRRRCGDGARALSSLQNIIRYLLDEFLNENSETVTQPQRRLLVLVSGSDRSNSAARACTSGHFRVIAPRGHAGHRGYRLLSPLRFSRTVQATMRANRASVLQAAVFIDDVCTLTAQLRSACRNFRTDASGSSPVLRVSLEWRYLGSVASCRRLYSQGACQRLTRER